MNNFLSVIVILGLVAFVYLGVFQDGIAPAISDKGTVIENTIDGTNVAP